MTVLGTTRPPTYYVVDFQTHKAEMVGEEYPALASARLGELRVISYKARDGQEISAYLTLPPGIPPEHLPLVVLPHGGPEARDLPRFDWWARFLATRGYAVLQPQFRGSTGFGEAFRKAGYHQWGGLMQDDVSDGVMEMVSKRIADPQRVCIVGASYGGYAALAGAAFTPTLYKCAVSVNGVSDLPEMAAYIEHRHGSGALGYWREHIGAPFDPSLLQRSPLHVAERITAFRAIRGHGPCACQRAQSCNTGGAPRRRSLAFAQRDSNSNAARTGEVPGCAPVMTKKRWILAGRRPATHPDPTPVNVSQPLARA